MVVADLLIMGLITAAIFMFSPDKNNDLLLVHGLVSLPITLIFLWIWFDTGYSIDSEYLSYNSGPLWGKIPLDSISLIKIGDYNFEGFRPCLSNKAIRIDYNQREHIYISPKERDEFLEIVLYYNPQINVT